ncbi:hypothetical protein CC2G_010158 [Coprinopsis cinerea AmutBmut pab1-1]|nr:hypothetical protein CC2G_010158 [Coprinopsis cinerea AmutBmut pab1-1]
MRFTYVVPAVVLATYASAAAAPRAIDHLFPRQLLPELANLESIPPQCRDDCDDTFEAISRCDRAEGADAIQCICRNDVFDDFDDCYPCLMKESGSLPPDQVRPAVRDFMKSLAITCRTVGHPVSGYDSDDDGHISDNDDDDRLSDNDDDDRFSDTDDDHLSDDDSDDENGVPRTRGGNGPASSASGAPGSSPTGTPSSSTGDDDDDGNNSDTDRNGAGVRGGLSLGAAAVAGAGAIFLL